MAARAQDRQDENRADERRQQPTDEKHQRVRHMGSEYRRGVAADAEESGAGEVHHPGVAELQRQAQAGHAVQRDRGEHQHDEVLVVEQRDGRGERRHARRARGERMRFERRCSARDPADAGEYRHPYDRQRDQPEHLRLRLRVQEKRGVERHRRDRGNPRESAHTRSAVFSAIRPVGRHAMNAITAANAKTSLYAEGSCGSSAGRSTAPAVCSPANRKPPRIAP